MKIEKLGPDAVTDEKPKKDTTKAGEAAKVERLKDESMEEVAGGVYCTHCPRYFA